MEPLRSRNGLPVDCSKQTSWECNYSYNILNSNRVAAVDGEARQSYNDGMFNSQHFYNSRGDGFPVMEIAGPKPAGAAEPHRFVPLKRTELSGQVTGPVADLILTQIFQYSAEQSSEVVEALYRFPLPGDAALRGVTVRFGEVEIAARLAAQAEAEAEYASAKEAGKQAVLATRGGPNVFTLQVAGLRPDQPVTVKTRFVQLAQPAGTGWNLRVPLTLAPRYVRADEATSHAAGKATEQLPLGLMRDPGHRFALDLLVVGAASIRSATHELALATEDGTIQVKLAAGEVTPDRDLVLAWTPPQAERPVLHALAYDDPEAGVIYFLAQVAPPQVTSGAQPKREVTLVVDHSGSMSGPKWEAADWATEQLLRSLTPADGFALAVFHNTTFWFERSLQPGESLIVQRAVDWFKARRDSGGTELGVALEQALSLPKGDGEAARAVLVVTDGQVTDHARLLQLADREFASADRRRISVLCIDSAPNDFLALQLAERGGGVARFLTSSPEEGDITTALDEILADWTAPALTGLRLAVDRAEIHAVGRRPVAGGAGGWHAVDLGDLPAGRVLWVAGWAPRGGGEPLTLRLELANGAGISGTTVQMGDYPALATVVAARRIAELEYLANARALEPAEIERRLRDLGYADTELQPLSAGQPALYAENRVSAWHQTAQRLLEQESLAHGLPSSATAFVAVRQEAGDRVARTVEVANALPQAWSEYFLATGLQAPSPAGAMPRGLAKLGIRSQSFLHAALPTSPILSAQSLPTPKELEARPVAGGKITLYAGPVADIGANRILIDTSSATESATGGDPLPENLTFKGVELTCDSAAKQALTQERDLALSIYIGDLATPRAVVRLRDMVVAGRRPLNLLRRTGEAVRIVLDAQNVSVTAEGQIELRLVW
jgi:Ca-activated chloride channel family protein